MARYHINELTKVTSRHKAKSFKISQPELSALGRVRRQCNAHRVRWPDCPKSLRDGRKAWSLPPGRYRLGGSIADLANRATGPTRGRHGTRQPTKGSLYEKFGTTSATGSSESGGYRDTISTIQLPAEMNKLLHPSKYFVGKIRPGDRMNDRPTLRLAISELTVCRRDPNAPGPGHYHPEQQTLRAQAAVAKKVPPSTACCCYTYDQYCREPFFRPPPGRYDIRAALPPVPTGHSRYRSDQIHIPIQSASSNPGADARPAAAASVRRKVTLRLNSINIPVRPRKGRRNMKVAFMSGSARFRDRDFFPIGGLGKATARKQQPTTSKKSQQEASVPRTGCATQRVSSPPPVERVDSEEDNSKEDERREKGEENGIDQFLAAHGISHGKNPLLLLPSSKAGHKMSTRFFTVPSLTRNRR